jgi:hypothetical protein
LERAKFWNLGMNEISEPLNKWNLETSQSRTKPCKIIVYLLSMLTHICLHEFRKPRAKFQNLRIRKILESRNEKNVET